MDFELSDDQVALRGAAAALLEGIAPMQRVRQVADAQAPYDEELWKAISEQGWLAVDLPEDRGGLGAGAVEVAVLAEQSGRHLAPVPFLPTLLARAVLFRAMSEGTAGAGMPIGAASVTGWVERLAAGEAIGAIAWSRDPGAVAALPADGRSGPDAGGAGWTLSGRSDPVVHGPDADIVIVPAMEQGAREEPSLFALALEPGERPGAEPAMDRTRRLGWLDLTRRPALRLGGPELFGWLVDRGAAAVSAEMLGGAERVLEMTVQYAKDRVQFGRPIGSFQAVKHRCADMLVDVEGMRSATYYAAWCVGAGDQDAAAAASAAKLWCSDASRRVMASGLQVHGGIGFTWEHDMHLFLKRAQLDQLCFGDATWHRDRLAALLRSRLAQGLPVL